MSTKKPYLKTFAHAKLFGTPYRSNTINHHWVKQIFSNLPNSITSEIMYVTFVMRAHRSLTIKVVCGNGMVVHASYIPLTVQHRIPKAALVEIQTNIRRQHSIVVTGLMNPIAWARDDMPVHNGYYLNISLNRTAIINHLKRMNHNEVLSSAIWKAVFHLDHGDGGERYDFAAEMSASNFREHYTKRFSWAIITEELVSTLATICAGKKVIDVGCGSGYLANLLKNRGIDIDAVDYRDEKYTFIAPQLMDVQVCDYRDVDYSKYDIVILSWPSYESSHPSELLDMLTEKHTLITCGEGGGGCTADMAYYNKLCAQFTSEAKYSNMLKEVSLSFTHIRDSWTVHRRARGTNIVQRKGKIYEIVGEVNNLVHVQVLDRDFKPIPHVSGSYDKAEFFKPESFWDF